MFKKIVRWKLERLTKKYFKKHPEVKLVVVVGAVGKTTTKIAIADVLAEKFRVQLERNNHNTEISVPLAIMGINFPPPELLKKISTWRKIFWAMKQRIKAPSGVDVIVQELGTERPGEIARFGKYLSPDVAVVTSVAMEHMENFPGGIYEVAQEELIAANFAKMAVINFDDVDKKFANLVTNDNITDYGIKDGEYLLRKVDSQDPLDGAQVKITAPEFPGGISAKVHLIGEHNLKSAAAATAVASKMGMSAEEIARALEKIRPVQGRMNVLRGVRGAKIIDDTYNSSPTAAIAALLTLYQTPAEQRIAILGTMNELGNFAGEMHAAVGAQCDPEFLDAVITIGETAQNYLAPAAAKNGCFVRSFSDPISAAAQVNKLLQENAAILIKGSQNGVFAEEATKILLHDAADVAQLVRQEPEWMAKKQAWFDSLH